MTDANASAATGSEKYELQDIYGLGKKSAEVLDEVGISTYADLARFETPAALHQYLMERNVETISLLMIENTKFGEKGDWIDQAREKLQAKDVEENPPDHSRRRPEPEQLDDEAATDESTAPVDDESESAQMALSAANQPDWESHAGFTVFFDFTVEDSAQRTWQTRVYHFEDYLVGQEEVEPQTFVGMNPDPWVGWILSEANLPSPLVIDKVDVSEMSLPNGAPNRMLAQVAFQLAQPADEPAVVGGMSFRVEIYLVNLEDNSSNLVSSELGWSEARRTAYHSRQQFPMPAIGRYRLYVVVLLLPPYSLTAYYEGSIINVVP